MPRYLDTEEDGILPAWVLPSTCVLAAGLALTTITELLSWGFLHPVALIPTHIFAVVVIESTTSRTRCTYLTMLAGWAVPLSLFGFPRGLIVVVLHLVAICYAHRETLSCDG